jgi:hypothetical protein
MNIPPQEGRADGDGPSKEPVPEALNNERDDPLMTTSMQDFGRRYTIEPRPEPGPRAPAAAPSPERPVTAVAPNGIRLFPGNALVVSRKFGSFRNQLMAGLATQDLVFTATEHGAEPELFIRVLYRCPRGVFVQTVRNDEEEPPAKIVTTEHRVHHFDRAVGQTVVIRPRQDASLAVQDLEDKGIIIHSWFDEASGRVQLHVAATEVWDVLAGEAAGRRLLQEQRPRAVREDSREFLQAFFLEAQAYLDGEEMDLLREKARQRLDR